MTVAMLLCICNLIFIILSFILFTHCVFISLFSTISTPFRLFIVVHCTLPKFFALSPFYFALHPARIRSDFIICNKSTMSYSFDSSFLYTCIILNLLVLFCYSFFSLNFSWFWTNFFGRVCPNFVI